MKISKEAIKELLNKTRDQFNALITGAPPAAPAAAAAPPVPPAPAPAAPAAPVAGTAKTYKLADGTDISVQQAGDTIAVGDVVSIAGAPATAGNWTLEDGTAITTDATGAITAIVPAPATTDINAASTPVAPPVVVPPVAVAATAQIPNPAPAPAAATPAKVEEFKAPANKEELISMRAKFATGSTEDRLANAEKLIDTLMEYAFGWQIRDAEQKEAIALYRGELNSVNEKMASHVEAAKGLFAIVEKIAEEPTEEPATLTGRKKIQFDASNALNDRLGRITAAIKANKDKVLS